MLTSLDFIHEANLSSSKWLPVQELFSLGGMVSHYKFGSVIPIWSEQLYEDSVMDQMCAASEFSSPRSYPWVGLNFLCVSVSPFNNL